MSRYRGPKLRIIRRLGELPGLTQKVCGRNYPAGQHGPKKTYGKRITILSSIKRKTKITF
jgi:small subunit ribosomal protein S4